LCEIESLFFLIGDILNTIIKMMSSGEIDMADTGKNDKGKKEQKKKPKLTIKEKRKLKNEKKSNSTGTV